MFLFCSEKQGDFFEWGMRERTRDHCSLFYYIALALNWDFHTNTMIIWLLKLYTYSYIYVHRHLEITWMTFLQSSLGPLLQAFFQTTLTRNKLNILKGNKIVMKFRVNLKVLSCFNRNNITSNRLQPSEFRLTIYKIKSQRVQLKSFAYF